MSRKKLLRKFASAPEAQEEGSQTCNVWEESEKIVGASETREELFLVAVARRNSGASPTR